LNDINVISLGEKIRVFFRVVKLFCVFFIGDNPKELKIIGVLGYPCAISWGEYVGKREVKPVFGTPAASHT
jgi:hypothetical protein